MKTLYYRCAPRDPYELVFAEPSEARRIDRIWHALEKAKTWGEFKRLMPACEHEMFEDCDAAEDDPFDAPMTPQKATIQTGFRRGWTTVIPADLLDRFGERLDTPLNGSFWSLSSRFEKEIVEELEGRGYRVFKRDDLFFY